MLVGYCRGWQVIVKYLRVGARGERARVVFACDCSVFGRVERHRKEYLVAFHGAQQRRNRCTQHTEKRGRSKENLHETIIFFPTVRRA